MRVVHFPATLVAVLTVVLIGSPIDAQEPSWPADWTRPLAAHRIVGNLYYVGGYDLASFLLATADGHILINTGLVESAEVIRQSVESLGYEFGDVRILLEMQAHFDHVAALARIKRITGAELWATAGDQGLLEDGGASDHLLGQPEYLFEPVTVDRIIRHGERISLGGTDLEVLENPGHTNGSTSFLMSVEADGRSYEVAIVNMGSVNEGTLLTGNTVYPTIASDYELTFERQAALSPDIWVSAHASQYQLHDKLATGDSDDPDRFVDPDGYHRAIESYAARFRELLAAER